MSDAVSAVQKDVTPPTFIVGCPRSGTTLLASLCDRHRAIAVTPESHFFSASVFSRRKYSQKDRLFDAEELSKLFISSQFTCDLALSWQDLFAATGKGPIRLDDFFRSAMQTYASVHGKTGWMEKTPLHLLAADRIFDMYPRARMICIYRDGRDVALSLKKLPWSVTSVRHYASLWRESAIAMLRCQKKWPDNFLAVRYESLLTDPRKTLTNVMNFVGLEFEPQQLDASLGTGIVPEWEMGIKKNVFAEIDPKRAYGWKRTATTSQLRVMHSMMDPLLEQFGYEPSPVPRGAIPVRAYDSAMNSVYRVAFSHKLDRLRWLVRVMLKGLIPSSPYASLKAARPVACKEGDKTSG